MNKIPDAHVPLASPTGSPSLKPSAGPPRRRVGRRVLLVLLAAVLGVAVWSVWTPRLPSGPLQLTRDEQGRLTLNPAQDGLSAGGEMHAASLEASNNLSSTSSEMRSGRARFACSRLAIFNRSQHLLMQRAGVAMVEHLKGLRGFEQVDYFAAGQAPASGELAPDVTVVLELQRLEESNLAVRRQLDATIRLSAASGLERSSHHYSDGLDAPRVVLDFETTLDHHSTTTGIGTPSSAYKLPAEDIGKQLGQALTKKLNDLYEQDGPLPELPADFYPAYQAPPQIPWPANVKAELVATCRGLMNANQTLWRLDADGEPAELLTDLQQLLEADNWRTNMIEVQPAAAPYLRMSKGAATLAVYRERRSSPGLPPAAEPAAGGVAGAELPAPEPLYAHYLGRMERAEIAAAVDQLIDAGTALETLLCFEHSWTAAQRERLLQRLLESPPQTPDGWLVLAEMQHAGDRVPAAHAALLRARLLLRTVADDRGLRGRIEALEKKLGEPIPGDLQPAPEVLEELGFVRLTADAAGAERELALDEPALFFVASEEGELEMLTLRVVEQPDGESGYALAHVRSAEHSRSWGRGGMGHMEKWDGIGTLSFQAEQIGDQPRFRLKVARQP